MTVHLTDAYCHVSLPRFLAVEELLAVLDAHQVQHGVVATADTCPDLPELSRAIVQHGDRLRAVGMPSGKSADDIQTCVAEQLAAGFLGIRLPADLLVQHPKLLDIIGEAGGIPFVVGGNGLAAAATLLLHFLEAYPAGLICAPHFAGVADPSLFDRDPQVRRLFEHPRFHVIFSRQGAQDQSLIKPWARAVVEIVGWGRIMFGSEYLVCLWRDETYADTIAWVDWLGPNPAQRAAYFYANAEEHLFARTLRPARIIGEQWSAARWRRPEPVWLFPRQSLDLPEETHRRLLTTYLARGGDARLGSYRSFVATLISELAEGKAG